MQRQRNKILMDFHVVKILISNRNIDRREHSEIDIMLTTDML